MTRRRTIIIWALYSLCAAFFLLLQNWVLDRITIWGVHPFIIPFLGVLPATLEKRQHALIYAFMLGLYVDISMPTFLPCFYCIIFPALAFLASLLSRRIIMSRTLCGLLTCGGALLCVDLCHSLYVSYHGWSTLWNALYLCGRELLLSVLVLPLLFLSYFNLHRFIANS